MTEDQARAFVQLVLDSAEITAPIVVKFDTRLRDYGIHGMTVFTDPPTIWLSPVLLDDVDELMSTAVHETAHILAGSDSHGSVFLEQLIPLMVRVQMGVAS